MNAYTSADDHTALPLHVAQLINRSNKQSASTVEPYPYFVCTTRPRPVTRPF